MRYTFLFFDECDHVVGAGEHEAQEDLAALEDAQVLAKHGSLEVWDGDRLVARLAKGGTAKVASSRQPLPKSLH